jgi:hypothetical protein
VRMLWQQRWWVELEIESQNRRSAQPYKLSWLLRKGNEVKILKHCLVQVIGKKYLDEVRIM